MKISSYFLATFITFYKKTINYFYQKLYFLIIGDKMRQKYKNVLFLTKIYTFCINNFKFKAYK